MINGSIIIWLHILKKDVFDSINNEVIMKLEHIQLIIMLSSLMQHHLCNIFNKSNKSLEPTMPHRIGLEWADGLGFTSYEQP